LAKHFGHHFKKEGTEEEVSAEEKLTFGRDTYKSARRDSCRNLD